MMTQYNYQQIGQVLDYARSLFRENARIVRMLKKADHTGSSEEYMAAWYYAYSSAFDACVEASSMIMMYELELMRRQQLVGWL